MLEWCISFIKGLTFGSRYLPRARDLFMDSVLEIHEKYPDLSPEQAGDMVLASYREVLDEIKART